MAEARSEGFGSTQPLMRCLPAADDLTRIDAENLARRADASERRGISAGHPDLRAKFEELVEQRQAPIGIEMGHHLIQQQ